MPAHSAIIFVHGFGGSALGTWGGFPRMLSCRVPGTDVYFYGYDSWGAQANVHAEAFRLFVDAKLKASSYDKLLLVGHSLGAIVIRRALLNAHASRNEWLDRVHIMFFAPAHMGATDVIEFGLTVVETLPKMGGAVLGTLGHLAGGALGSLLGGLGEAQSVLGPAVRGYGGVTLSKSLRDLQAGSETLRQLLDDSRTVSQSDKEESEGFLTARKIIFGHGEDIVDTNRFQNDPVAIYLMPGGPGAVRSRYLPACDHIDVCKPRADYLQPVELVVEVINTIRDAEPLPAGRAVDPAQLSPDPGELRRKVVEWVQSHSIADQRRVFRYHDKAITDETEISLRKGLDLLVDLASVAEVACCAGVLAKSGIAPELMGRLGVLGGPGVAPYYEKLYPSQLVAPFLARTETVVPTPDRREAFMGFWALQARLVSQKSIGNFLGILDDLGIQDEEGGWIFWPEVAQIVEDPRGLSATLMAPGRSERVQAVRGYRAFLLFCLDFHNYKNDCQPNPEAAAVATEAWYHFLYWFNLFEEKFRKTVDKQSEFLAEALGPSHPALEEVKTEAIVAVIRELAAGPQDQHTDRTVAFLDAMKTRFELLLGVAH